MSGRAHVGMTTAFLAAVSDEGIEECGWPEGQQHPAWQQWTASVDIGKLGLAQIDAWLVRQC